MYLRSCFSSFGYIPRSEIAYGNSIFNFLKGLHTVQLHRPHSQQQCHGFRFFHILTKYVQFSFFSFLPSFFFIVAIPVDATWHLFVVLICISLMITADKNIFMCLFAVHVFFWSILLPIFMPVSYSLDYCRFVVNFEIWKCGSSIFVLLQDFFGLLRVLKFKWIWVSR